MNVGRFIGNNKKNIRQHFNVDTNTRIAVGTQSSATFIEPIFCVHCLNKKTKIKKMVMAHLKTV